MSEPPPSPSKSASVADNYIAALAAEGVKLEPVSNSPRRGAGKSPTKAGTRKAASAGNSGSLLYVFAALPWMILAPLNVIKLFLNKVSPTAHYWVPRETEQCQGACGIARMWAELFWTMQFVWAFAYLHVYLHPDQLGLVYFGIATKIVVGAILLNGYMTGVVLWPNGIVGSLSEWLFALLFTIDVVKRARNKRAALSKLGEISKIAH